MNKEIRKLMIKHKLPESIMTLYGLEIERIVEDYNQQQIKIKKLVQPVIPSKI